MKITIQSGINIWRIAGRTVPVDGVGIYQGRLLSEVRMTKQLARVGNTPITLPINIRNNDAYISSSIDLWGADVTVVSDSGYTWRGKITAYDSDGGGIMYITATEKSAPELLVKFPDEVARLVTLDENFHVSAINVTLPMVVGGTVAKPILVKGILIDKTAGIYLLCVGDNHQIPNVYRGTELLTAGFVAYTGTAGQANYPGFAYVQLTDESLRKNDDGTYVEISADVVGLKLGTHTIEECRNGARFLLWLLKTAREGVGGWGLGIAESDIDLDAFNTAIARVDTAGLKMDGIFYFRQIAQSWIDQICHAIRGSYSIGDNGKRRLFVNAPAASRKTYTKKNIKLLRYGKGAYTGQVYNKGKIEFGFNPLVGQFTQTAQYEDATSIGAIDEQEFTGQSYLVREMATGKALIDYTCKKSLIGATKVYFETKELPDDCHEGDIITVDYPEKGISGTWQINILDIGDRKHRIEAEKFSETIFVSGDPGTAIDWSQDPPIVAPFLPGAPTGLDLSTVIDYDSAGDGAARPFIEGTFTPPEGKYLGAAVFWGLGAEPVTWNSHGSIRGTTFRVGPVKAGQLYTVKVHLFNQSGPSAEITGSIVGGSHTELPPAPTATASAGLGCIVVNIAMPAFSALAGFDIQRQTSAGAELTTVASGHRSTFFPDDSPSIIAAYGTYQYRVRAVSNSRQTSAWSAWTTSVSATQAQSKDITANQIIAKDFRTACNVGCAQDGVMFNAAGLQAWCGGVKTVDIPVSGSPTFAGTIAAAAGNIGGWEIKSTQIVKCNIGGVNNRMMDIHSACNSIYFYQGNEVSGVFLGQTYAGSWTGRTGLSVLRCGSNIFEATYDASNNLCAKIAGWDFNNGCLWASNLVLNSAGSIQTCDFVSGNKGWKIDCVGDAEFNNICARGAIRTAVFIKDEISVVGGRTLIRPAGVSAYNCNPAADCFSIFVNDTVDQFALNDIIRMKSDENDFWGRVCACGCNACGCYISFVKCSGARFNLTKGQAIVNYGSCAGCGGVLLDGQAPYIDVYTHNGSPWNGTESRVRLGNLCGWGALGLTYGIAVGCPTGNHMTYDTGTSLLKIRGDIEVMSTGNILPDPDFRGIPYTASYCLYTVNGSVIGEWVTCQTALACVYAVHKSNGVCLQYKVKCSGTLLFGNSKPSYFSGAVSKNFIPVQAGATYTMSAYLASHPGYACPNAYVGLCYYTSNGTAICYDYFVVTCCTAIPITATRFSGTKTMPENAAYVKAHFYNAYTASLSYLYVSGVQLELGNTASLWKSNQGGTVTADMVRSGSLVSTNYVAGSVGSCINMDIGTFSMAGGALCYDGSSLSLNGTVSGTVSGDLSGTMTGTVCSCSGSIGGWSVGSDYLQKSQPTVGSIYMCPNQYSILIGACTGSSLLGYASFGHMYWGAAWKNAVGISVPWGTSVAYAAGVAHNGTVALPDSTTVACTCPFLWIGDTTNYVKYYDGVLTTKGTLCASAGCIANWTITTNAIVRAVPGIGATAFMSFGGWCTSSTDYPGLFFSGEYTYGCTYVGMGMRVFNGSWHCKVGIVARVAAQNIFQIHACGDGSNLCANIAGWNFNNVCLWSGNLIMNSAGAISGNYTAGSAGWCISSTGAAEFNNVTVRGTVCASCGQIGCFSITGGILSATMTSSTAAGIIMSCGVLGTCSAAGGVTVYSDVARASVTPIQIAMLNCSNNVDTQFAAGSVGFGNHPFAAAALAKISISAYNAGGMASTAAILVNMVCGTSYYAMCTNGRISVSGTVYPSDRNLKTDFELVSVLPGLRKTPIAKWRYKGSKDYQIGPVAQDFNPAFQLVCDWQTNLTVSNLDGIALRGVQELDECVSYNNRRILELESRNACLETRLNCLETEFLQLKKAA